jgi:hypothetical protein
MRVSRLQRASQGQPVSRKSPKHREDEFYLSLTVITYLPLARLRDSLEGETTIYHSAGAAIALLKPKSTRINYRVGMRRLLAPSTLGGDQ